MKRDHRWIRLVILSFLLLTGSAIAQSLEQAAAQALAKNPDLQNAMHELLIRQESINAARGEYLPSLDLEAGYGYDSYDNDAGARGDYDPVDLRLSLRQLIWDGSNISNDIERNKAEAEAQRYQLLADSQDKVLRVAELYLEVLEAGEVVVLSEKNLGVHQRIFSDVEKRTTAGIGSTADFAQVAGRLSRAETSLISAQNNYIDFQSQFIREVGAVPVDLVKPEVDATYIPPSLDKALEMAEQNNPVLQVAANDIDATQYQYKQAESEFYPTITLEASQLWGDEVDAARGSTDEFTVGLKLRYNLFNGGTDRALARRAAMQVNQAKDVRNRAVLLLEEGTRLSWSALDLAIKQEAYLQQHVDAAAKTVIAYEKQFRIGKRTLLDVLNTENELFQARKDYLQSHYDGIFAKYRLLNSAGVLLNEMRLDVPPQWNQTLR